MPAAEVFVYALAAYGAAGLVFAAVFVAIGIGRVDPAAQKAPAGFRLIVLPGCALLWPLLLRHIILVIGPLCRLDRRFLPLLYNRRHLGVTMFFLALAHGAFSLAQFHALGDVNPLVSLWTSNTQFASVADFPFQALGFF